MMIGNIAGNVYSFQPAVIVKIGEQVCTKLTQWVTGTWRRICTCELSRCDAQLISIKCEKKSSQWRDSIPVRFYRRILDPMDAESLAVFFCASVRGQRGCKFTRYYQWSSRV